MYYYKLVEDEKITSVESKSVNVASPNFVEATKGEYDTFMASLPVIEPEPQRDLAKEIDELKAHLDSLEVSK